MSLDGVDNSKISYNWSVSGEGKSGELKLIVDGKETTFPCTVLPGKESAFSRGLGNLAERVGLVTRMKIPPEGGGKDIRVWNFHLGVFLAKGTPAERNAQLSRSLSCKNLNKGLKGLRKEALQFIEEENKAENNQIIEKAKGYLGKIEISLTKSMSAKLENLKEGGHLSIGLGKGYFLRAEKGNGGNLTIEIHDSLGNFVAFPEDDLEVIDIDEPEYEPDQNV